MDESERSIDVINIFFFKLHNEFNILDEDELQKRKTSQNFIFYLFKNSKMNNFENSNHMLVV